MSGQEFEGRSRRCPQFEAGCPPFLSHRRLCSEVPEQWVTESSPETSLLPLVRKLAVFCLEHSAESEACDMLMEIEKIDMMLELVSEDVHERVCLYLVRSVEGMWCGVWL